MALVQTEVDLCNMALGKIGANRITLDAQGSPDGIQCNLHYEQTRDALQRMYHWSFANARAQLVVDATAPAFEYDVRYPLPDDFLRMRSDYTIDDSQAIGDRYTIEGNWLLTNDDEVDLCYVKKVTDPDDFDPLFKELMVLSLAVKMLYPLAGVSILTVQIGTQLGQELRVLMTRAKMITYSEVNVSGRSDWNWARYSSGTV